MISSWLPSRTAAWRAASFVPYCSKAVSTFSRLSMRICDQSWGLPAASAGHFQDAGAGEAEVFLGHGQGQDGGGDVRQMACQGQGLIVFLGRHLHDHEPERTPKLFEQIEIFGAGILGGREDGHSALEEVGRGVVGAGLLAAGQRMAAEETATAGQSAVEGGDDRLFRAGDVADERPLGAMLGGLADVFDDMAGRRADDDQIGVGNALVEVDGGMRDGADAAGDAKRDLLAVDADDVFRQISLAQGQTDRAADESNPHNGDGVQLFHGVSMLCCGRSDIL